ncbi:hypothetical protein [Amycolatopsis sp. NPDC051372]
MLTHEGAVRAIIAATVTRPADATARPGLRFASSTTRSPRRRS